MTIQPPGLDPGMAQAYANEFNRGKDNFCTAARFDLQAADVIERYFPVQGRPWAFEGDQADRPDPIIALLDRLAQAEVLLNPGLLRIDHRHRLHASFLGATPELTAAIQALVLNHTKIVKHYGCWPVIVPKEQEVTDKNVVWTWCWERDGGQLPYSWSAIMARECRKDDWKVQQKGGGLLPWRWPQVPAIDPTLVETFRGAAACVLTEASRVHAFTGIAETGSVPVESGVPPSSELRPRWDAGRRRLSYRDWSRSWAQQAVSQMDVLKAFEDNGWPSKPIESPFGDDQEKTKNTVRNLNDSLRKKRFPLQFSSTDSYERIAWEYAELP